MNPRARKFKRQECEVCGFAWSDIHHLDGGKPGEVEEYVLCPNHHRCAHMIQSSLRVGHDVDDVRELALRTFDEAFNEKILEMLLGYPERLAEREKIARRGACWRQWEAERRARV